MKYNLIMFNMSEFQEWKSGVVNRNYHILHNLLDKNQINKIIAVDFLPYTKKRALRLYARSILKSPGGKRLHLDLTSKLSQISDKLYIYSSIDSIFSENKVYKKLNKLINKFNLLNQSSQFNTLIWSYFPMFVGYYDYFHNHSVSKTFNIFDTVDNWIEHPNFFNYQERLKKNYATIAKKANLIFTVAQDLLSLYPNNKNKYWLPNGVDLDHFQKKSEQQVLRVGKPIIGYVGTIEKRLDFDLIEYLANNNKDKSIALIGPVWKNAKINNLKKLSNIHFLGRKSYQELPFYINEFDIAIIPHKIDKFTKSMNPLKLYEYLACGKPIVATQIAGIEKFQNLIYTANSKEEFNSQVNQALMENNSELAQQRKQAVQNESWKNRVNQIIEKISNNLAMKA